jgi:putative restriction endonuclease
MPIGSTASMSFPFYHLDSSKFWHLISQKGEQHQQGRKVGSVKRLLELYQGSKLDDDLFVLLCNKENRQIIRKALISHYFASDAHNILWDQATINTQSSEYCKHLLKKSEDSIENIEEISTPIYQKVRSQGFRKAIVRLYEHRCALCGIRILTTEGHTVVDAAHIIPWSQTQNDSPQNGMALCKLCHWSFDEGLMGVDKEYNVLISRSVRKNQNYSGHIEMLSGRGMIKPDDDTYWPDQANLNSHRKNKCNYSALYKNNYCRGIKGLLSKAE